MKAKLILFSSVLLSVILIPGCTKTFDCKGPMIEDCLCTMEYDPVCGCDGETYGNACSAGCSGVKEFTKGECK